MLAKLLKKQKGFRGRSEARERQRSMQGQMRRGNRARNMADVANLAVLLVEGVAVPVNQGMHAQRAHHYDEDDGQYPV